MEKDKIRIINENGVARFVTPLIGNNEKLLKSYGYKKEEVVKFIPEPKVYEEKIKEKQNNKEYGVKGNN